MFKTGKKLIALAGVAILGCSAPGRAAVVSFSAPTTFSSVSILDDPYNLGGAFVSAMNIGDIAKTFTTPGGNTITFSAGNGIADLGGLDMPAAASSTTGFFNGASQWSVSLFAGGTGSVEFDDILRGNAWHTDVSDGARPLTLRLAGLTIGATYEVYLYSVDGRSGSADRSQAYWDDFSDIAGFRGSSSGSFAQSAATVVKGTFTANDQYQDIFIQATDDAGNADTSIAAYTLFEIAPVPEPGVMALLLCASLGLGFAARRKCMEPLDAARSIAARRISRRGSRGPSAQRKWGSFQSAA